MRIPAGAVWIGPEHPFDLHEVYLNFRKDFELDNVPAEAQLFVTADSRYKLWINGNFVNRGPSRCWPHAQQVDEHDVSRHFQPGPNTIAVQVYSPGYSHFAYVHRGACGLLAWLEADGRTMARTDTTWQVQRDLSWSPDVNRVSIYGSGVERRDMALAVAEWKPARIVAEAEGPLWCGLRPRDVPLLNENVIHLPIETAMVRSGPVATLPSDPHDALRTVMARTKSDAQPRARLAAGECAIWIFDLGISRIGHGTFAIAGAKGGERLLISYAEKTRGGELVISDPATYCQMRPTDEFILRAGDQRVEPFSQRGGRYVIFCLHAPQAMEFEASFSFAATSYPLERHKPTPPDESFQPIIRLCEQTTLACLQDSFVDSVWRESSQWLGDCVSQAFALQAISNDVRPLRRAITMAAEGAYGDGVLPSVLPGEVHAYTVLDYNFSWIELLRMYVDHPAASDREQLIASLWPTLCKMIERFDADRGEKGLIVSQPGRRLFLDWSPVDRREPNLTYNCRYLFALQIAAELARWCDEDQCAEIWNARASRLRSAITAAFPKGGAWHENGFGTPASQLGLSLLLLTDCADNAETLCGDIVARSLDLEDRHEAGKLVLASPFMHHYVFQALEKNGHRQAILDIIRARWGRWASGGESTCWENWSIDFPDGSACHGFSAHPLGWIMRLQAIR